MKGNGLRNFLWNSAGATAYEVNSLLFMIVVTRISPGGMSDAGVFSLTFSSSIIFLTIAMYGVRAYQVTDVSETYSGGEYSATRLITCAAAFAAAVLFAFFNRYDGYKFAVLLLLSASKIIEGFSDVYFGILQKRGRLDLAGKANLMKSGLGFLAFYAIMAGGHSLLSACVSLIVADLTVLFLFEKRWVFQSDRPRMRFSRRKICSLLAACFPVFAVSGLSLYLINIPRFAVDSRMTSADLGVYGILFMQANIIGLLTKYLIQFSMTGIAEQIASKDRRGLLKGICGSIAAVLGAGVLLGVFYQFFGSRLLRLLFGYDLAQYMPAVAVILGGSALYYGTQVFYTALTAMRVTRVQLYIVLADVVLGVLIASPLVSRWGIAGAAGAFLAVAFFQFAAAGMVFSLSLHRKFPRGDRA